MVQNTSNNVEQQRSVPVEKPEKKQEENRELQKTSQEFVEGVAEVVENAEVSEGLGEDKKKGPQGQFPSTKSGGSAIKTALKPLVFPGVELMQIQIATAIKREIVGLEKMAEKLADKPFALTGVVAKIRELNFILHSLAHATFDTLKNWWMKFVKNGSN